MTGPNVLVSNATFFSAVSILGDKVEPYAVLRTKNIERSMKPTADADLESADVCTSTQRRWRNW